MSRHDRIDKVLTTILRIILVGAFVVFVVEQQWLNAVLTFGISVLTLLPAVVSKRFSVNLPTELEFIIIVFIFASLFLGEIRDWYNRYWWWDAVLHTGSGLMLGMLAFLLVYVMNREERVNVKMNPLFVALFSFTFAVASGAVWEIFEYTMDRNFGMNMQKSGLVDTMWDLIVDTIGALIVSVFGFWYLKYGTRSIFVNWIQDFVKQNPAIFIRKSRDSGIRRREP